MNAKEYLSQVLYIDQRINLSLIHILLYHARDYFKEL